MERMPEFQLQTLIGITQYPITGRTYLVITQDFLKLTLKTVLLGQTAMM